MRASGAPPVQRSSSSTPGSSTAGRRSSVNARPHCVRHDRRRDMTRGETLADAIDALLPQTQCGKCGFPGCRPYAEALVDRAAAINQCPPGGDALAHELAALLGVAPQPLDPAFGTHRPPAVAVIDESAC